jgi:AhpD family alkylhydroperoxidase
MTRLRPLPVEDWDHSLRGGPVPEGVSPGHILAHQPAAARALGGFSQAMRQARTLPDRLVELVRLRVAFHNQCRSCMAIRYRDGVDDGVTEGLVCSLEKPYEAPDLTAAEKSALRFADLFAADHLAIDEAVYADLRSHFTEAEIVELGIHVAFCVGFGRLMATWDVVDDLPAGFQARDRVITPWSADAAVVG